jgi:poly-beta-1,6-N-acetyl-D-glucosamine synthase
MRILIVAPFLNEVEHLPTFLDSVAAQSRLPDRLVLVDDGSTDDSAAIAEAFAEKHDWARVLRRPPHAPERDRLASSPEWKAFLCGVESTEGSDAFDIVAKVDADLRLRSNLLAQIEALFTADPLLGLTGPYLSELDRRGVPRRLKWRPEHVAGATKFYRRQCYEQVYPLPFLLNLDMVDELKSRSLGWRTGSFAEPGGDSLHLRAHGSHDGVLRGFRRWGRGDYVSGSHPLLVLLVGLQRLRAFPPVVGTLNYWEGWMAAAWRRDPRFDPAIRELRRQEQLACLRARISEGRARLLSRVRALPFPAGTRHERPSGGEDRDGSDVHGSAGART